MAIYQEKNRQKWTKDGRSWYYKCYYTDMYGNRKQKVSKLHLRKKDAEEAERIFLIEIEKKDETDKNIMFVHVYNEWLDYKKTQVKSTTYYSRKKRANLYIVTFFKDYKLHNIKIDTINKWKTNIINLNVGLEHKNRLIADLREILEYAKNNFDFDGKILSKLQKYRVEKIKNERNSNYNFWSYDDFKKFIQVIDNNLYYTMFNFLYYTGVRFGEMAALNWNDINLERKTLQINKTLSNKVEGKKFIITEPKTKNSNRIIDLDNNLVELLHKHKQNEKKIYNFNNEMFVFGNVRYIPSTSFTRKLNYYITKAGVKKISPHGFRHSHVSLLINLGCDSRDVAERIGDTIQVVEKTYYHMFPQKKKQTVEVLNMINLQK